MLVRVALHESTLLVNPPRANAVGQMLQLARVVFFALERNPVLSIAILARDVASVFLAADYKLRVACLVIGNEWLIGRVVPSSRGRKLVRLRATPHEVSTYHPTARGFLLGTELCSFRNAAAFFAISEMQQGWFHVLRACKGAASNCE